MRNREYNVNLELYRIFKIVADKGSFSSAAKGLFISQPAISQSICQLEKQLGIKLFKRSSKGVSLTSEGSVLYNYIESALKFINAGEEKLLRMSDLYCGEIKISAGDTLVKYFLLPYLERFNKLYPDINVKVTNRMSSESAELVRTGIVDIAFVNLPIDDSGLYIIDCINVNDIFVVGNKYKEICNDTLGYDDIAKYPLIMLETESSSRRYVQNCFLKQGIILEPEIELGSYDLLCEFAKIGLGISCVIEEFSQKDIELQKVYKIKLKEAMKERKVALCYSKDNQLSLAAKAFVDIINS